MKRIIAILTKQGALCNDLQENTDVNIFKLEEERVVGYEYMKLQNKEYDSFSEVLRSKKINLLYMNNINEELRKILRKAGCSFKSKDDLENDEFIKRFIFS